MSDSKTKTKAASWAGEATTLLVKVQVNEELGRQLFERHKTRKAATARVLAHLTRSVFIEDRNTTWGLSLIQSFEEEDRDLATKVVMEAMDDGDPVALKVAAMERFGLVEPVEAKVDRAE